MHADASPNVTAASLKGAGGVGSNSGAHVVKTPITGTLQGLSRVDSMSRSEKDAFERGAPLSESREGGRICPYVPLLCTAQSHRCELHQIA